MIIFNDDIVMAPNENAVAKFCEEYKFLKEEESHVCLKNVESFLLKKYNITSEILVNKFLKESQYLIYEIISVKIVDGWKFCGTWENPMQEVITDKGTFIDNVPNAQYGFYGIANPGFDWSLLVGKRTINVKIFSSKGFNWINYQSRNVLY